MNVKLLIPALLLTLAVPALAEDPAPKTTNTTTSTSAQTDWNTSPAYWERVLTESREQQGLRLGKSDWRIKGPLVEGLRRKKSTGDRSAVQRLAELPVVRLLVPQPMPSPPGGGKYFLWGETDRPSVAVTAMAAPTVSTDNLMNHEARTSLISIGK